MNFAAKQENVDAIIINPGALHTSIALRDAFLGVIYHLLKFIFQIFIVEKNLEKNPSYRYK